jgi:hypothetical protein
MFRLQESFAHKQKKLELHKDDVHLNRRYFDLREKSGTRIGSKNRPFLEHVGGFFFFCLNTKPADKEARM